MNIQEFISSGIIENYVLGLATPEEIKEVEALAAKNVMVKMEIDAAEKTLFRFAQKGEVAPRAELKEKILAEVMAERIKEKLEVEKGKVIELKPEVSPRPAYAQWLAIAASVLLIGSVYINIKLNNDLKQTHSVIAELNDKNSVVNDNIISLRGNLDSLMLSYEQVKHEVDFMKDVNKKMICMGGGRKFPGALAHVYWNTQTKQVQVELNSMPATPDSMQYQLWAIAGGKALDMGIIPASSDTTQKTIQSMKEIDTAQAFAITLEKKGGSPTPTGSIFVMGRVGI